MSKLKMDLVSIYAPKKQRKAVLERLQLMGAVDIETTLLDEEPSAVPQGYERVDMSANAATFERNAQTGTAALTALNERFPEKKGLIASFSGRREISAEAFYAARETSEKYLRMCSRILELERKIAETGADTLRLKIGIEQLLAYRALDVPLSYSGTRKTAAFIGSVTGVYSLEQLLAALAAAAPELDVYAEIISLSQDQTYVFITCPRSDEDAATAALRTLGFARPSQNTSRTAADKIASREEKLKNNAETIAAALSELEEYTGSRREIELLIDYFTVRAGKYRTISDICQTGHTILIRGYIPQVDLPVLKQSLEQEFDVAVESEPADPALAPVKLKNNRFATPAEIITEMYSLPSDRDIDPSPLTGFFYYLFFGMMLADIGYGLLIAIGAFFIIKKLHPEASMKKSLRLFVYCGISTALWGVVYGSFFGDSIAVISETFFSHRISLPALIDPMNGGAVTLLLLSLALGFVQILAGLIAKAVVCVKNHDIPGALFDSGLWIVTLLGLLLLAVSFTGVKVLGTVGAAVSIAGAVGLVLTQGRDKKGFGRIISGLASLYDITGYVSDLLSFSRLMALGLTSAAMAAVFNKIGTLAGKGVIGILMLLIIFPLGHAINIGLNALGAYVHTLRLQYVELFSKFYEGGGREFKPFAFKSKYVRIKEDK